MEFLDEKSAARMIGMSPQWLKLYRRAGKIRYYRIGKVTIRYRKSDLEDFLKKAEKETKTDF